MSAVGSPPPPDLMRTYMLRSSTPGTRRSEVYSLQSLMLAHPYSLERERYELHDQ